MATPTHEQLERLRGEVERLRGELEAIVHVCRAQALHDKRGRAGDPVVSVIESIAVEALHPRRDRRSPR